MAREEKLKVVVRQVTPKEAEAVKRGDQKIPVRPERRPVMSKYRGEWDSLLSVLLENGQAAMDVTVGRGYDRRTDNLRKAIQTIAKSELDAGNINFRIRTLLNWGKSGTRSRTDTLLVYDPTRVDSPKKK